MTFNQWILFFLLLQVIHFLGTWKLYQKAGRKWWEALVPVYNAYVLLKIIQRPIWWIFILFIPIVNVIFLPVLWVETIRSFRRYTTLDTILVIVTFGFYIYYINYFVDVKYNENRNLEPLNFRDDFIGSITYAVIFATFIHTFFIQPFIIPSSSLEKSLLIGDMLFVSKFHYGARTPQTAVSFPMVHDTIIGLGKKSYLSYPQYPKFRFPGFQKIKHNDIVVFNWPADTVYRFWDKEQRRADKPLDKRSNYVKRCVGLPGDILKIENGDVLVNGSKLKLHDRQKLQYNYIINLKDQIHESIINEYNFESNYIFTVKNEFWQNNQFRQMLFENNINAQELINDSISTEVVFYFKDKDLNVFRNIAQKFQILLSNNLKINITKEQEIQLKRDARILKVEKYVNSPSITTFPHNQPTWSIDNMGPIKIPKEGEVITLNEQNLPLYERLITTYENNTLEQNGDKFFINGKETKSYTIQQDYYWMMGDNRHGSEDSRYWGFVPFDHVLGKPVFIWMSFDQEVPWSKLFDKVRWERLFTTVGYDGKPHSYFIYFVIFMVIWQGYVYYKKRKNLK
jgi:signal peptidase I